MSRPPSNRDAAVVRFRRSLNALLPSINLDVPDGTEEQGFANFIENITADKPGFGTNELLKLERLFEAIHKLQQR